MEKDWRRTSFNGGTFPLSSVDMTLSGTAARTSTGNAGYFFTDLNNGSYVVTPSKDGFAFTPPSANVDINNSDQTISFTAVPSAPPLDGRIVFRSGSNVGSINANGTAYQPALSYGSNPSLSRDGRILRTLHGTRDLGSINADGFYTLTLHQVPFGVVDSPVWSPDETKVAFTGITANGYGIRYVNAHQGFWRW